MHQQIVLPDLVANTPFPWAVNPHYERARAESAAWLSSFKVFNERKRAFMELSNSELLVGLTYSYADFKELRTCCDFVNLLFVFDEISDKQGGEGARKAGARFLSGMRGEPGDGSFLARITEQYRTRFVKKASPSCQERFLTCCTKYINAVSREADLREHEHVLDMSSYMSLRRDNSAVPTCFSLFEYVHGIDIPQEVFDNPVFMRLYYQGIDMVCLSNDLYSYSMEYARGLDGNNIITVVMQASGCTLQEAADHVGEEYKALLDQFLEDRKKLPSFGTRIDEDVQKYVFSITQWCIGNLIWSFESPRYFGVEHDDVKATLVVKVKERGEDSDEDSDE